MNGIQTDEMERKIIEENFQTSEGLNRIIERESNVDEKLKLIHFAADFNTRNQTTKYADMDLEKELLKISQGIEFPEFERAVPNTILHVMTECYNSGGHTRVVGNWIEFDSGKKHSVLITNTSNSVIEVPKWLEANARSSGGEIITLRNGRYIEKAQQLALIASKYEKIILHIHNQDLLPLLAFGRSSWKTPIYFFNHSTHLFWLGVSISDLVLDFCKETFESSIKFRGVMQSEILPLPIKKVESSSIQLHTDKDDIKTQLGLPKDSYIITSMASSYKYTDFEPYNFFDFCLRAVSLRDNVYFLLIGPDIKEKRWRNLYGDSKGKIIPLGIIDKDKVLPILSITDYYVDSFFLGSTTSVFEAAACKLPLIIVTPCEGFEDFGEMRVDCAADALICLNEHINGGYDYAKIEGIYNRLELHYKDLWRKRLEEIYQQNIGEHTIEVGITLSNRVSDFDINLKKTINPKVSADFSSKIMRSLSLKNKLLVVKLLSRRDKLFAFKKGIRIMKFIFFRT